MHDIGAHNEAEFYSLVRYWYMAEDDPGISASLRCKYRLDMREWFMKEVNFGISSHLVDTFPIVLYEGLLVGIER